MDRPKKTAGKDALNSYIDHLEGRLEGVDVVDQVKLARAEARIAELAGELEGEREKGQQLARQVHHWKNRGGPAPA